MAQIVFDPRMGRSVSERRCKAKGAAGKRTERGDGGAAVVREAEVLVKEILAIAAGTNPCVVQKMSERCCCSNPLPNSRCTNGLVLDQWAWLRCHRAGYDQH